MSEKMDYRADVAALVDEWEDFLNTPIHEPAIGEFKAGVTYVGKQSFASNEKLESLILALLDKVRQEQAEEIAKHHCISDVDGGAACSACDWKHAGHMSQPWQGSWAQHVTALGRK